MRFFSRLVVFITPIASIVLVFFAFSWHIGEVIPPSIVTQIQLQAEHEIIYRPDWTLDENYTYKLQGALAREPDVLVLTTSRGFFFQDDFFTEPDSFYNASIPGLSLVGSRETIDELINQNIAPDIVIINIEYYRLYRYSAGTLQYSTYNPFNYVTSHTYLLAQTFLRSPELMNRIVNQQQQNYDHVSYGVIAHSQQVGFRNDGSYYMSNLEQRTTRLVENELESLYSQTGRLSISDTIDMDSLEFYDELLQTASMHDITIVGYIPPVRDFAFSYAPQNGTSMSDSIGVATAQMLMMELFAEYDMPFFIFDTPQSIGGTDDEMYDLTHAGERLTWRMFRQMVLEEPELFAPYTSIEYVDTLGEVTSNPLYLLDRFP